MYVGQLGPVEIAANPVMKQAENHITFRAQVVVKPIVPGQIIGPNPANTDVSHLNKENESLGLYTETDAHIDAFETHRQTMCISLAVWTVHFSKLVKVTE